MGGVWSADRTFYWYQAQMKPGSILNSWLYPGWHDPVSYKLFLKAERANPRVAAKIWPRIVNRAITQAYRLTVADIGSYTAFSKRVGGVERAAEDSIQLVEWFPTR